MCDPEVLVALRCPRSGDVLDQVGPDAASSLREELRNRQLALAGGGQPPVDPEGFLRARDAGHVYPVLGGVPLLLAETAVVPAREAAPGASPELELSKRQLVQMEHFSRIHNRWYAGITEAQQRVLREGFYSELAGCEVLDLGNGGLPPEHQLGMEEAASLRRFVALDKSYAMLTRNGLFGNQVVGDARAIPLANGAVDFVLANGVIHHLGLRRGQRPQQVVADFFVEALRVSRRGIVVMDLVVPLLAECMERLLVRLAGSMPTVAYSQSFFAKSLERLGLAVRGFSVKAIGDLLPPLTMIPPILDLEWLRIPVALIPYSFVFFRVDKDQR